jgi:cytochrome bd-type quinol oxidase subunit 2
MLLAASGNSAVLSDAVAQPAASKPQSPIRRFEGTIDEAAAPHSSLAFIFWGARLFVFPLTLLYTAVNYTVFRGKVRASEPDYRPRSKS